MKRLLGCSTIRFVGITKLYSKMSKFIVSYLICFLWTSFLNGQSLNSRDREALHQVVQKYSMENAPGMAVGIVQNGEIIFEQYQGFANLEHRIKISQQTRFNIASTAKQFTALMVLDLAKQQKIDLEDDIRTYIPSLYPTVKEAIKIRHLLNHTSGIRDYIFLLDLKKKAFWKQVGLSNKDILSLLEKQKELAFSPGKNFTYSNSGYIILAEIIEIVTGVDFNEYSDIFFKNLDMHESSFIKAYMQLIPNRAAPYSDWGDGKWKKFPLVIKTKGDGLLFTTLKDQLTFEQKLQEGLLDGDDLFTDSQGLIENSEINSYGFGLEQTKRLGKKAIHHSGSTVSYNSQMIRFPDQKLSIIVLSNNGNIWSGDIADELAKILLHQTNQKKKTPYDKNDVQTIKEIAPENLIGYYYSEQHDFIRIDQEANRLFWKENNQRPIELWPISECSYTMDYDTSLRINFKNNEMAFFNTSGDIKYYNKKIIGQATSSDIESILGIYQSEELDMRFELKINQENQLLIQFSNRRNERKVEVLNRNELIAGNFRLQLIRDSFDRVIDILLSLGRAKNNRFKKINKLYFNPKISLPEGSLQVTTIHSSDAQTTDILLTKNDVDGHEIWSKIFGGSSYDRASSIVPAEQGFLIIGSTSSFGSGNYDMFVICIDAKGRKIWQKTYGGFYNDYGYTAEKTEDGYIIKGTEQDCSSNTDIFNRTCKTYTWFVTIDKEGNELSNHRLEEINIE